MRRRRGGPGQGAAPIVDYTYGGSEPYFVERLWVEPLPTRTATLARRTEVRGPARRVRFKIGADEHERLRDALDDARLHALNPAVQRSTCADCAVHAFRLADGTRVEVDDGDMPPRLVELTTILKRILARHRPRQPAG